MKPKNIFKRYGKENFDYEYESTVSFDDINNEFGVNNSYYKSINNRISSINKISNALNGFSLICTHGELIMVIKNYLEKKWETNNLFGGKNYCGGIECHKTKKKLVFTNIIPGNVH